MRCGVGWMRGGFLPPFPNSHLSRASAVAKRWSTSRLIEGSACHLPGGERQAAELRKTTTRVIMLWLSSYLLEDITTGAHVGMSIGEADTRLDWVSHKSAGVRGKIAPRIERSARMCTFGLARVCQGAAVHPLTSVPLITPAINLDHGAEVLQKTRWASVWKERSRRACYARHSYELFFLTAMQ
jgi:hypothetical protein